MSLKYDPMGNRVWKQSIINGNATNRNYIVDISGGLPTIICEFDPCDTTLDSRGSLKKQYVYTPQGQILVQYDCSGYNIGSKSVIVNGKYFYVHDRLGSVRLVLDVNSTVRNSYTYSPFGEMFASECNETVYNPFKFTGQYYLRARQYDPVLMRFTSIDTNEGDYEEPMSLHKYLYCWNDPINYIDISGNSRRSASHRVQQFTLEQYEQLWHARFDTPEEINLIKTSISYMTGVVIENFAAYASEPAARALSPVFAVVTPAAAAPGMYRIAYEQMFRNGIINAVINEFWGEETDLYDIQDYWAGY